MKDFTTCWVSVYSIQCCLTRVSAPAGRDGDIGGGGAGAKSPWFMVLSRLKRWSSCRSVPVHKQNISSTYLHQKCMFVSSVDVFLKRVSSNNAINTSASKGDNGCCFRILPLFTLTTHF